ncbi:MAG: hypothetical protein QF396_02095 [Gammaproteobacteria bacterium]|jgi:hypothetical protein|nr:hypothetical protein [Gammaproteobacteria bacterium]
MQVVRFGISWVARLLGISGFTIQQRTSSGSLQALNVPKITPFNPSNLAYKAQKEVTAKSDYHLNRLQSHSVSNQDNEEISGNDQDLLSVIATLKSKLYQERSKSRHYDALFNELNERLVELEKSTDPDSQKDLQKLQGWVHSNRVIH